MALLVGNLTKSSLKLLANNVMKQLMFNASRPLYSANSMGINGYLNAREYVKSQFHNIDHMFYNKMKDFVDKKEDSMIFTEDLKTMLHICEKKMEDLELLYKMLIKYKSQNNLRFGSFIFGTVVMRLLYHLDEPDFALKAFMDPKLDGFFDQIMTHQLLMDLLYNHGRYNDVIAVYDVTKSKNINGIVHPKNPFILVMAACYQENTPQSLKYAKDLFTEAQNRGYEFPRRSITFLAALALKQKDAVTALEVAALARNVRYIDIRCVKVVAFTHMERIDEIMVYFRESLQNDSDTRRKQCYFHDTIEEVEKFIEHKKLDENHDLVKMLKQLKLHDYVQTGTLHDHITATIESVKVAGKPWQQSYGQENLTPNRFKDKFRHQERERRDDRIYSAGLRDRA
ncbi:pentatricopeptide repeat-containing protein 2, mitochondrial [Copidosoma floridanum]|uniref:pentatricopeptide repeat-containing protein 2, mitochondrial n=1 Tax=Copidosoma floridanum TaxID=29053 RepID=UPI0006C9B118|nr:pentatricopeptide repeat-containing protein 2, mitochondrial [Copidosoma floridanum]